MTHPAYLLAKLNAKSPRMDGGFGGIPELTASDIAAAIAFVPEGLGREIMCRLWWPEGSLLTARELDRLLMNAQLAEWRERIDVMLTAQLRCAYAELPHERSRAHAALDAAKAKLWPRLGPESCYEAIRRAVLAEMSSASLCPACKGRGYVPSPTTGAPVRCTGCNSTGRRKASDRMRAEMIERDESTYRRAWKPVYEWTEQLCLDALGPAEDALSTACR